MDIGKFSKDYENQFALIIKKKDYFTKYVQDVRGYKRPVTTTKETIQDVLILNEKNFKIHSDGTLSLDYTLKDTGEYIFEYGRINPALFKIPNGKDGQKQAQDIIVSFAKEKLDKVSLGVQNISYFKDDYQTLEFLVNTCVGGSEKCDYSLISQKISCLVGAPKKQKIYSDEVNLQEQCQSIEKNFPVEMTVGIEDILDSSGRRYFTLVSHGDQIAQNPVQSDNKITVLSEKISYKLGEKARVLVRLPFTGGKILWTVEKQGVIQSEYIDVPGNIFFKEIEITDDFLPNAYIGVVAINPDMQEIPEYKVGYTEIVVDKTDKKSDITIQSNKQTYKPREKVTLDISVQNPLKTQDVSELTVMVVDDSLISLMGNVDLNILEKIYRKLPFQIQTSMTNIAMLRNYYFSRQGIVGGSGMGNNKG